MKSKKEKILMKKEAWEPWHLLLCADSGIAAG